MITLTKGRFDCFISGKYLSYGEAEVANPSGPHPGDLTRWRTEPRCWYSAKAAI